MKNNGNNTNLIGKIVIHPDFSFPAKVAGKYPNGWRLTGYRNTGVNPNRVYQTDELQELTVEDFDKLDENSLKCLIRLRDK